jgi:hypothetical protein
VPLQYQPFVQTRQGFESFDHALEERAAAAPGLLCCQER